MTIYVGIDPDLHDVSIGYWLNDQPASAAVIHVPKVKGVVGHDAVLQMVKALAISGLIELDEEYVVAVEAQTLMRSGHRQHKRPQDIVILGNVAGAILMQCVQARNLLFPTPEEWKGQIPKAVMQARMFSDLGWGYQMVGKDQDYARPLRIPEGFSHISSGQWKHVGDALLLARWASQQRIS